MHHDGDKKDPSTTTPQAQEEKDRLDESVDEQSEESFPASDAPSFTPMTSIAPPKETDTKDVPHEKAFPMRKTGS